MDSEDTHSHGLDSNPFTNRVLHSPTLTESACTGDPGEPLTLLSSSSESPSPHPAFIRPVADAPGVSVSGVPTSSKRLCHTSLDTREDRTYVGSDISPSQESDTGRLTTSGDIEEPPITTETSGKHNSSNFGEFDSDAPSPARANFSAKHQDANSSSHPLIPLPSPVPVPRKTRGRGLSSDQGEITNKPEAPAGGVVVEDDTGQRGHLADDVLSDDGDHADHQPEVVVREVVVHRAERESLGLSIVPSYGSTRDFYQIKRLLPGGACARSCSSLAVGDRLVACNGESLKGLTQVQCLQVLKSASSPVSLTVLHTSPIPEFPFSSASRQLLAAGEPQDGSVASGDEVLVTGDGNQPQDQSWTSCEHAQEDSEHGSDSEQLSHSLENHTSSPLGTLLVAATAGEPFGLITDSATMSNPFLDDVNSVPSPAGSPARLTKTNPFYQDLLGPESGRDPGAPISNDSSSFFDFLSDPRETGTGSDGLSASNVLLDLSGGEDWLMPSSVMTASKGDAGKISGNNVVAAFGVPPPTEFSDVSEIFRDFAPVCAPASAHPPVTNIDDLLGMDLVIGETKELELLPPAVQSVSGSGCSSSRNDNNGLLDESFDFLVDAEEAKQDTQAVPVVQDEPPPLIPTATFPGAPPAQTSSMDEHTSTISLPLECLQDNVSVIPIAGGGVGGGVVHVTDIMVSSSFKPHTSSITVSSTKTSPRSSSTARERSPPGPAVVRLGSLEDAPSAQIYFDNSEPEEESGPASALAPSPGKPDMNKEESFPTSIHRDKEDSGCVVPEDYGKQKGKRRHVGESDKHDFPSVMAEINTSITQSPQANRHPNIDGGVGEDEIVPVILTRRDEEIADMVLARWVAGEKRETTSAPTADSALRKAVIQIQTGRADLPENAIFHTTMGVTRIPQPGVSGTVKEDAITPVSVLKDQQGNKHYVPCTTEREEILESVTRKVDESAKHDIADFMVKMDASPSREGKRQRPTENKSSVEEGTIERTVLAGDKKEKAMAAVSRWLAKEAEVKQLPASAFQKVVENVIVSQSHHIPSATSVGRQENVLDSQSYQAHSVTSREHHDIVNCELTKAEPKMIVKMTSSSILEGIPQQSLESPEGTLEVAACTTEPEMNVTQRRSSDPFVQSPSPPPEASARASPPRAQARDKSSDGGAESKRRARESSPVYYAELRSVSRLSAETRLLSGSLPELRPSSDRTKASRPTSLAAVEMRPGAGQRSSRANLRLSMGSLSQVSSILSRSGGQMGAGRTLLGRSSKSEYSKTRCDDAPFLVEVLNGIVGLGIKVAVTSQGLVQVTEVQRNSPVDKNGNMRIGDYILCVNTTEVTGQHEGRVQQVFRLLPRGLVKLLVSTQPPATAVAEPAGGLLSPRQSGTYTQFGVRLSPLPFGSAGADNSSVPVTSFASVSAVSAVPNSAQTPCAAVASGGEEEEEDTEDMSGTGGPFRLSKALSPRGGTISFEAPKPTPRQKVTVPTPEAKVQSDFSKDEGNANAVASPRKADFVTAAARRSGRDEDLPATPEVFSSQIKVTENVVPMSTEETMLSEQCISSTVSILNAARHPSGIDIPRDEVLPVFVEAAKKLPPTPVPRSKVGSSPKRQENDQEEITLPSMTCSLAEREVAAPVREEIVACKPVIHCENTQDAPSPLKVPPPVAPKPSRLPDLPVFAAHPNDSAVEVLSPTFVSPRLSEFVDPSVASPEEQLKCRKFVSSAARMFEEKATEQKPVQNTTKVIRSSLPITSVIQTFSKEGELEAHGGKPINRALMPDREKRKSTPLFTAVTSAGLTKPASLSPLKDIPTSNRVSDAKRALAQKVVEHSPPERTPRINSALQPRHSLWKQDLQEEQHVTSPPHVGKAENFDLSFKSPAHSSHHFVHAGDSHEHCLSLSTTAQEVSEDGKQPKMVFSSSSLHHDDRKSWSPSSSSSCKLGGSDVLDSTIRKFDDLLSDKHEEEQFTVSNSVSLDLESWNANREAAKRKIKKEVTERQDSGLLASEKNGLVNSQPAEQKAVAISSDSRPDEVYSNGISQITPPFKEANAAVHDVFTNIHSNTATQELHQESQVTKEDGAEDIIYKVVKVEIHQCPETLSDSTLHRTVKTDSEPHQKIMSLGDGDAKDYPDEKFSTMIDDKNDQDVDSQELEAVSEQLYEQHASALVESVLKHALSNVASIKTKDVSNNDASLTSPFLPEEEPPPLPGAPPPPLILRDQAKVLITAADLEEMLQSSNSEQTPPSESPEADREFTELDRSPRYNQPVSDTLSEDSGVLDEEDSPTSNVDSSTFELVMTPDEIIASVVPLEESVPSSYQIRQQHSSVPGMVDLSGVNANDHKDVSDFLVDSVVDVHTDFSLSAPQKSPLTADVSVSQISPSSQSTFTGTAQEVAHLSDSSNSEISNLQDSHFPKCSSIPHQVLEVVPPGGASTTGKGVKIDTEDLCKSPSTDRYTGDITPSSCLNDNTRSNAVLCDVVGDVNPTVADNESFNRSDTAAAHKPDIFSNQKQLEGLNETKEDFVEIISPRTLYFLDPSGSLFLQCPASSPVSLSTAMLWQVSSLHPQQLLDLVAKGNEELTSAQLPSSLELKLVAAQSLDGGALNVDVTQREDYFVQVTRVRSVNSTVQEGDMLLSVDGQSLRYKRPAQVLAVLEDAQPKSVALIARGLKLKLLSVSETGFEEKKPVPPSKSPSGTELVASGVFEVVMIKGPTGVGFCLEGGKASPLGDLPIVIKRIFKGGPAEKCGQLKVKDEILAVNGVDFTDMRHYEAWNHLKFLDDGEIHIKIRRH